MLWPAFKTLTLTCLHLFSAVYTVRLTAVSSILRPLLTALTRTCMSCSATGTRILWSPLFLAPRRPRRWRPSSIHPTSPSSPTGVSFTALVPRSSQAETFCSHARTSAFHRDGWCWFVLHTGNGGRQEIHREAPSSHQRRVDSGGVAQRHGGLPGLDWGQAPRSRGTTDLLDDPTTLLLTEPDWTGASARERHECNNAASWLRATHSRRCYRKRNISWLLKLFAD